MCSNFFTGNGLLYENYRRGLKNRNRDYYQDEIITTTITTTIETIIYEDYDDDYEDDDYEEDDLIPLLVKVK